MSPERRREPFHTLKLAAVTGGFSGLFPFAPGTAGSAAACLVIWLLPRSGFLWYTLGLALVCTLISGALGSFSFRHFGRKDPGPFVLDEFAGMFVTVAHPTAPDLPLLVLAFLLFRVFDIVKPFPARQAESLPGGWGIVADDLIAGVFASLALLVLRLWAF